MARAGGRKYQRRRLVVNRPMQFRFIRAVLLTLAIAAIGILYTFWVVLSQFEFRHDPIIVSLFTVAATLVVLNLLVLIPLFLWMWIVLTHKVAGPLVRVLSAMTQMSQGDYNVHLRLRKGDFLVELAESVNRLADSLRRRPPHRG